MAIVAGMTARSAVLTMRSCIGVWRLLGRGRMGAVHLVVVVVLHVVSMMPSLPLQGDRVL